MKMKALLSMAALLLVIMTGCGNTEESGAKESSGNGKADKVTINILQNKTEIVDQVNQMTKDYMKENPNVEVNAQVVDDYTTLRKARFASGQGPDIFFVKPNRDMKEWEEHLVDLSGEPWMEQVADAAKPGMTIDGKSYGFPVGLESYGFIYNKDLFEKAGITEVPKTVSELEEANKKLEAAGVQPFAEGYKEDWVLGQHLFSLPFASIEDPVAFADALKSGDKTIADNPYFDGFFKVLDMTVDYGEGTNSIGIDYTRQLSSFTSGKTAMIQQGTWAITPIKEAGKDLNIGMFAVPMSEDAEEARLPIDVPAYYVVNKNSKNVEEAKKFLTWMHENGDKYLVDSFNFIPAFKDIEAPEDLGPLAADLIKYSQEGKTIPWAFTLWPSGIDAEFAVPLQAYVAGQQTKEEAIKALQDVVEQRIK
jgi:raffinose/stachyose/melibiose transport system substrate-binding protein